MVHAQTHALVHLLGVAAQAATADLLEVVTQMGVEVIIAAICAREDVTVALVAAKVAVMASVLVRVPLGVLAVVKMDVTTGVP